MGEVSQRIADYLSAAVVPLAVSGADAEDHALLQVNDAFCTLTGYRADQLEGRSCRLLQGALDDQPAHAEMRAFFADPSRPRVRVHIINFRADGSPFVNMLTLTRLLSSGGVCRFILGTQFDITAAAPSELLDYDAELRRHGHRRPVVDRDIFIGSVHSMAEAAAAILQARLLLEDADRAGLLA